MARSDGWSMPVVQSAITRIDEQRVAYRGHELSALVRERSVEEVAALLWTGSFDADIFDTPLHVVSGAEGNGALPFLNRAQSMLPLVAAADPAASDLRPQAVAECGWRILNLLASIAVSSPELGPTVEETLAAAWAPSERHAAELIRAALIVSADHRLNASALTVRCAASAGSNPYSVVVAGLAALDGVHEGGVAMRVESLVEELHRARDPKRTLTARLRRGETIAAFDRPLHRHGDPRAAILLELLRQRLPESKELARACSIVDAAGKLDARPTLAFALATVSRVLSLPQGSPLTLFAIGRSIGWIAHAIEQYALPEPAAGL